MHCEYVANRVSSLFETQDYSSHYPGVMAGCEVDILVSVCFMSMDTGGVCVLSAL